MTHIEAEHPRNLDGTWTNKPQGEPDALVMTPTPPQLSATESMVERAQARNERFDLYFNGEQVNPGASWEMVRAQGRNVVVTDGTDERVVWPEQLKSIYGSVDDRIISDALRGVYDNADKKTQANVRDMLNARAAEIADADQHVTYLQMRSRAERLQKSIDKKNEPAHTVNAQQREEILKQMGASNILAISGGRVQPLPDGVELPVSNGYRVRVRLQASDTYSVERVYVRKDKVFSKGLRRGIYADQVGMMAYYASCYNNDDGDWEYLG